MDMLACVSDSKMFLAGAVTMGILMFVLMIYAGYLRAQNLWLSFKHESAIKLGNEFYYVVSEHEFNRLKLIGLRNKPNQGIEDEHSF